MKLPFLYEHLKKTFLDNKEQILDALTTHDWTITSFGRFSGVNCGQTVVDLESNKGYWLSNVPLDLFPREVLVDEITTLINFYNTKKYGKTKKYQRRRNVGCKRP